MSPKRNSLTLMLTDDSEAQKALAGRRYAKEILQMLERIEDEDMRKACSYMRTLLYGTTHGFGFPDARLARSDYKREIVRMLNMSDDGTRKSLYICLNTLYYKGGEGNERLNCTGMDYILEIARILKETDDRRIKVIYRSISDFVYGGKRDSVAPKAGRGGRNERAHLRVLPN